MILRLRAIKALYGWATGWKIPTDGARVVFAQPILTRPGTERVAFIVPVRSLDELLRRLDADRIDIEHVDDY